MIEMRAPLVDAIARVSFPISPVVLALQSRAKIAAGIDYAKDADAAAR